MTVAAAGKGHVERWKEAEDDLAERNQNIIEQISSKSFRNTIEGPLCDKSIIVSLVLPWRCACQCPRDLCHDVEIPRRVIEEEPRWRRRVSILKSTVPRCAAAVPTLHDLVPGLCSTFPVCLCDCVCLRVFVCLCVVSARLPCSSDRVVLTERGGGKAQACIPRPWHVSALPRRRQAKFMLLTRTKETVRGVCKTHSNTRVH